MSLAIHINMVWSTGYNNKIHSSVYIALLDIGHYCLVVHELNEKSEDMIINNYFKSVVVTMEWEFITHYEYLHSYSHIVPVFSDYKRKIHK